MRELDKFRRDEETCAAPTIGGAHVPSAAAVAAAAHARDELLGKFLGGLGLQAYESLFAQKSISLKDLQLLDDVLAHTRTHLC